MLCHILGIHYKLSMHLPQATCPIHHAAQLTVEQKVTARYESPRSINEQPLFNSPAKHPHLPGVMKPVSLVAGSQSDHSGSSSLCNYRDRGVVL